MSIFYKSLRVGKNGNLFYLYKFRTFKEGYHGGTPTAAVDDPRLTKLGSFLRKTKLDEIPILFNLLKRDISLVGWRPDVPLEIETLDEETKNIIFSTRPGIVSPATLWNSNEDEILKGIENPHEFYCANIKPTKYKLNVWYIHNKNWWLDAKILFYFVIKLLGIKMSLQSIYPPDFEAHEPSRSSK